jgi:hypothetical protein
MLIKNWIDGKKYILNLFRTSGFFVSVCPAVEGKPHWVLRIHKQDSDGNKFAKKYYCVFKHADNMFGTYAQQFEGTEGQGESINKEVLDFMELNKCDLIIAYSDGKVYQVNLDDIREFVFLHKTIRKQYGGETTVSFPLRMMQRLNKNEDSAP